MIRIPSHLSVAVTALILAVLLPSTAANGMATGPKTSVEYSATSLKGLLDPEKPVIAVDIEGIASIGETKDSVAALYKIIEQVPEGYQLFALDSSLRATLEKRPAASLRRVERTLRRNHIPYIRNDFEFTPFRKNSRRFSEIQLEKLKRLKFLDRFPVIGVITRPVIDPSLYSAAGIELIDLDEPFIPRLHDLEMQFLQFKNSLYNPDRDQWVWDGLTNSRNSSGNSIEFISDNAAAADALILLAENAMSFIHISNYAMEDDPFGRRLAEVLIKKAQVGVKVRVILDRITTGPFGSDYGLVWLSRELVRKLRKAGVELLFHELVEENHGTIPSRDVLVRRHRKMFVTDRQLPDGATEVVAFAGSRVLASFSFENTAGAPSGKIANALGVGWGSFRELSFLIKGPVVTKLQEKFLGDFVEYGGRVASEESTRLLVAQPRYPANTGLRYVTHESFRDQNTLDTILRFLEDEKNPEVTLVNSFIPDDEVLARILAAAEAGKKVTWIMGGVHFRFEDRVKLVPKLFRAGIQVYLLPAQLQTKLYASETRYAFGTHNLAEMSQRDTEDLFVMKRDQEQSAQLDRYIEDLKAESALVGDSFGPGAKTKDLERFAREKLTPPRDGQPLEQEHTAGETFSRLMQFLWSLPYKY